VANKIIDAGMKLLDKHSTHCIRAATLLLRAASFEEFQIGEEKVDRAIGVCIEAMNYGKVHRFKSIFDDVLEFVVPLL
jgi:uncharacterized protein related to proFAR isomerase